MLTWKLENDKILRDYQCKILNTWGTVNYLFLLIKSSVIYIEMQPNVRVIETTIYNN